MSGFKNTRSSVYRPNQILFASANGSCDLNGALALDETACVTEYLIGIETNILIRRTKCLLLDIVLNVGQQLRATHYLGLFQCLPFLKIVRPASQTATGRLTRTPATTAILRSGADV